MIHQYSLIDFFKAHNIDIIKEIGNNKIKLAIQTIHLYFNICLWHKTGKIKEFHLYDELINYNCIDTSTYILYSIPFELRAKYMTYIFEMLSKENASKEDCIQSIYYMNNMIKTYNKCYYNTIYISDKENDIILFIYEDNVLILNMKDFSIYQENNLIDSISTISELLNNKPFFYQFVHVAKNNTYRLK